MKKKPQNKNTLRPPAMQPAKTFLFVLAEVAASFRKRPKSTVDSLRERINLCRPSVLASFLSSGTLQLKGGSSITPKQSLCSITYRAQGRRSISQTLQDTSLLGPCHCLTVETSGCVLHAAD